MKTIEIKLYEFKELGKKIQEKVIENLRDINVEHKWYDFTYEDAETIGLKITAFNIDYSPWAKGEFIIDHIEVAEKIFENHGKNCDTYKIAEQFKEAYYLPDANVELEQMSFLKSILNCYAKMLQSEYEQLTSDEAVIESIEANEYTFEQDGTLRNE